MKFKGKVIKGKQRGKKLGFPTANLACAKKEPAQAQEGVWTALAKLGKRILPSIVFLGQAKTFGEKEKRIEIHLLDFKEDIYGKAIEVMLLKRIRGNKKFKTQKSLITQMKKDEKTARKCLQAL